MFKRVNNPLEKLCKEVCADVEKLAAPADLEAKVRTRLVKEPDLAWDDVIGGIRK
jgi:hypothetical protein